MSGSKAVLWLIDHCPGYTQPKANSWWDRLQTPTTLHKKKQEKMNECMLETSESESADYNTNLICMLLSLNKDQGWRFIIQWYILIPYNEENECVVWQTYEPFKPQSLHLGQLTDLKSWYMAEKRLSSDCKCTVSFINEKSSKILLRRHQRE